MKSTIKIVEPVTPSKPITYPCWGMNPQGDLFLMVAASRGIAVQYWTTIEDIAFGSVKPLPSGTKIEIAIF